MIKEAIDRILSLGEYNPETIDKRTYQNGPGGILALKPPKAETLVINTLTGIVDYKPDVKQLAHVIDHKTVHVIDAEYVDEWLTRSIHLTAVHESPVFRFGQFMDVEEFIINLQALFVQDEHTAAILKVVGNLKEENVTQFNDDGQTQAVTARAGISTVTTVPVPNPVALRPYRTFMEIEQPESTFVFRMRSGGLCALFEADGRMWRLEAIKSIREWLDKQIPGIKVIA